MKKFTRVLLGILLLVMLIGTTPMALTANAAAKNTVKTSVSKVVSKAKGFTVTWKKKSGVKGYQIQYSTSSKFTKSTTKTKTVSGASKVSATINKLKGCNTTYYVRIRTYKTISGKTVYSAWSSVKKVSTLNHSYTAATCTKAKTCKYCAKTSGKSLGHKYAAATCTKAKTCTRCKKTTGKALGHKYAAATCTKAKTCTRCKKTTGKALGHKYAAATCTKAKTCTRCKKTTGKALGHKYAAATCTEAKTCSRCKKTSGSALGHTYSAATCIAAATCSKCGKVGSGALGHNYEKATCDEPKTCKVCGMTSGNKLGHSYSDDCDTTCDRSGCGATRTATHNYTAATCTEAKTCTLCKVTSGSALGHEWRDATCTEAKTCSRCKKTSGNALGHNYVDNTCTRCGESTGKVTLTIGIQPSVWVLDYYHNALTNWLEEECNVELEFIEFSGGMDVQTQISTMIAGRQELPDILFGITLDEVIRYRYGEEGYFVDMQDYFADKNGVSKTFWNRLTTELGESDQKNIVNAMTDNETGSIYAVPSVEISDTDSMNYQTWINTEWLDKVGKEKPTNKEELLDVLRAFRDTDCNGNGIQDEIPLFGTVNGGTGAHILDWFINLFVYYDREAPYVIDEDGKLVSVYTTDEYREALKFMNEMYKEGLLSSIVFTASSAEMKAIITPASGTAMAGIFVGHLTAHTTQGSPVLQQYEPLQTWGYAVRRATTVKLNNLISADCDNPEKAFEVMMKLWSQEGSYRIRYGEKGVNWTDPDEGAVSAIGLPATLKIINDPIATQNSVLWGSVNCTLLVNAEGETAQMATQLDAATKLRMQMHAESNRLFTEAAQKNNPKVICPKLWATVEEKEYTQVDRINISGYANKSRNYFILGNMDVNDDAVWQQYVNQLKNHGLDAVVVQDQAIYNRQK